jgi:antitoxin component of MazEF toxin-antitoxin module
MLIYIRPRGIVMSEEIKVVKCFAGNAPRSITIPAKIRDRLGLKKGMRFSVKLDNKNRIIYKLLARQPHKKVRYLNINGKKVKVLSAFIVWPKEKNHLAIAIPLKIAKQLNIGLGTKFLVKLSKKGEIIYEPIEIHPNTYLL